MKTHILFLVEGTYGYNSEYIVKEITEKWHLECSNFKGSLNECKEEAVKQKEKDLKRFAHRYYVEPHYPNADYSSIYDY